MKNLTAGKPYYFAVAAEDTKGIYLGSENYSNEIKVTPLAIPVASEKITVVEESKVVPQKTETTLPAAPAPTLSSVTAIPTTPTPVATSAPATTTKTIASNPVTVDPVTLEAPKEKLPQSGPIANLVFGFSVVVGLLWSQRKRLWVIGANSR